MSFDISRLRRADWIVGGGAIALFIFTFFFKWYGVSSNITTFAGVNVGNVSRSGWDTFTNSRWIWLITIIVAIGAVVLVAGQRALESPVQPSVIVTGLGALSTVLILYRIIHHPTASASVGAFHASVGIKIGIWLGLIAAAVITYGGYLQMQGEGTSLSDVRERASGALSAMTSSAQGSPADSGGAAPSGGAASAPVATPQTATPPTPSPPAAVPPSPSPGPPIPPPAAAPPSPGSPGYTPPSQDA
jgi:hypothetical protein